MPSIFQPFPSGLFWDFSLRIKKKVEQSSTLYSLYVLRIVPGLTVWHRSCKFSLSGLGFAIVLSLPMMLLTMRTCPRGILLEARSISDILILPLVDDLVLRRFIVRGKYTQWNALPGQFKIIFGEESNVRTHYKQTLSFVCVVCVKLPISLHKNEFPQTITENAPTQIIRSYISAPRFDCRQ